MTFSRIARSQMTTATIIALFFILALFVILYAKKQSTAPQNALKYEPTPTPFAKNVIFSGNPKINNNEIQTKVENIQLVATEKQYSPNVIHVQKNSIVKITLQNKEGYHNFMIDEYNIVTPMLATNKTSVFSFAATISGTFTFYSNPKVYKNGSIKGTFIVE